MVSHNAGHRTKSDGILSLGMPISKQRISDKSNDERPGGSRERWEKETEAVDFFGS